MSKKFQQGRQMKNKHCIKTNNILQDKNQVKEMTNTDQKLLITQTPQHRNQRKICACKKQNNAIYATDIKQLDRYSVSHHYHN